MILVVQPGAHGIAAGKKVGMALAVHYRAAAAHGKTHHGALSLAASAVEFLLNGRHELLKEPVFERPAGHIEIAVLVIVYIRIAGIGHDDDHGLQFFRCDELVGHVLHPAQFLPGNIAVTEPVQQVNHRVMAGRVVSVRQVHVAGLVRAQKPAVKGFRYNTALCCRAPCDGCQGDE